ncbi:MAG: hypothetical protein H6747_09430 [Deltaproteobacteria bacterium]|nr:hypothetical protein [Deltaproteobacteria bacterium]
MIRVARGDEPAALAAIRQQEIQRVGGALAGDPHAIHAVEPVPLTAKLVGKAYQAVAGDLWRAQFRKCCHCEMRVPLRYNDVEHFRPKASVRQRSGGRADPGYWWLAWTWENLLFACASCNRSSKNDQFPLVDPTKRLRAQAQPPGHENPLLLDPAEPTANPEAHLHFDVVGEARGHVSGNTPNGACSVEVYGLHRDELVEVRALELDFIDSELEAVSRLLRTGRIDSAQKRWTELLESIKPQRSFAALRRAALAAFRASRPVEHQAALAQVPASVW